MPDETNSTGVAVQFGVGAERTLGVIQSETENNSAEVAEARDENGQVIVQKAYSKSTERTIEALFITGTAAPAAGTVITIGDWTGLVTSANITKSNTDFVKMSITATHKDNATLLAYS